MSSSTLRKRVSDLISIVDNAPSYYHDLYSQYASNTFTNDIRYLSTLSDPLVEACLSGSSGAHTQALMPLFSNLTLFRSYLSSLCLSNRIKRLACSGAYDPVFSLHFLKHGYVSIPNFLPPDLFQSLSSALSLLFIIQQFKYYLAPSDTQCSRFTPIHFGTRFLDYSFSQLDTLRLNVSNLIASVTASILQPVGGQINYSYTHDQFLYFIMTMMV